eukprot:TRINITY_DN10325_c0_g1_i1.p1 TRINITY_DN10325_c0_g1~~TRINITY_DN10325_c0_g1_i1.p1  ORF type:complete len:595 (-),score=114.07 TRINITY_DN10325_c0_g1_i1:87-1871(-)
MMRKSFSPDIIESLEGLKAKSKVKVVSGSAQSSSTPQRGWVMVIENYASNTEETDPNAQHPTSPPFTPLLHISTPPPSTHSLRHSNELRSLLSQEKVNLSALKKLSWYGIPKEYRAFVWKLLMGYLPPDRRHHEYVYSHRRKLYKELVSKHYKKHHLCEMEMRNSTEPEIFSEGSSVNRNNNNHNLMRIPCCSCFNVEDQGLLNQIRLDVPRTATKGLGRSLYNSTPTRDMLVRLLYVWAKENSDVGYIQGLNDLPAQFIIAFLADYIDTNIEDLKVFELSEVVLMEVEADTYWCLSLMMAEMREYFVNFSEGMAFIMKKMGGLVKLRDPALSAHLEEQGCDMMVIALRWVICLLTRELSYELSQRLWDSYLSHGEGWVDFHIYVCAAFLTLPVWSKTVQKLEFSETVVFIQQLPTSEWREDDIEELLVRAYEIYLIECGEFVVRKDKVVHKDTPESTQEEMDSVSDKKVKVLDDTNEVLEFFRYLKRTLNTDETSTQTHTLLKFNAAFLHKDNMDGLVDALICSGLATVLKNIEGGNKFLRGTVNSHGSSNPEKTGVVLEVFLNVAWTLRFIEAFVKSLPFLFVSFYFDSTVM